MEKVKEFAPIIIHQVQQQMVYQQAFLQNAVAQNMQIQQQLLMQNQALTQLLQQSRAFDYLQLPANFRSLKKK